MATLDISSIKNFVKLTDRIGTSGQPREQHFANIAAQGYRWVINLAMPDHADALINEDALVTSEGMAYLHIPVNFKAPQKSQVRFFCQLMSQLHNEKIFVHCIMNYRVSAFMFHYLRWVEGWPEADARSPMFGSWQPDAVWKDLLSWTAEDIGL